MWVSAWVAVAWFATLFLYQYLRYHFSGHPLRQLFLTTPSASPRSYPGVSPLVFHPLTKKQQRNTGERDATGESACAALSARLFRTGAPDILETPRRP